MLTEYVESLGILETQDYENLKKKTHMKVVILKRFGNYFAKYSQFNLLLRCFGS